MASTVPIDEEHLRGLKRPELQRLAREHKIKANLKTEVIVGLLLQRLASAAKPQVTNLYSCTQHDDPVPPPVDARDRTDKRGQLVSIPTNPDPRRPLQVPRDVPSLKNQQPKSFARQPARDLEPNYPGSPPNIGKEQLPAPEALVRETVAMLAELEKGDQQLMDQIVNMGKEIEKLRSQTRDTRALLRSENARRQRAVQYYLYWHPIASNWSYDEVWSGKVKVRDDDDVVGYTTSDEEDRDDESDKDDTATNPGNTRLRDSNVNDSENIEDPEAGELLSPIAVPVTGVGETRTRSCSPSDDEGQALKEFNLVSPPQTPVIRIDKGKARMTSEQVEALEREHVVERLLAEVAAEVYDKTAHRRAGSEEHTDNHGCNKDETAALEVQPIDLDGGAHVGFPFEVSENPNIAPDDDNPFATHPAGPLVEVIKPDQNQEQEEVLGTPAFSSASHQPRYIQRTLRKRKRLD